MKKLLLFLLVGVFILGCGVVYAVGEDSDNETSDVSLTIPHAAKLVISEADSSKTLVQDSDSETDFDNGYTDLSAGKPNIKVSANKNWKLSVKSSGFAGPYAKLMGDLQLKHTGLYADGGFSDFTPLSGADQDIAVNATGVKNESYDCQYRILLDYSKDVPGTYTATVTYTLATLTL